MSDEVLLRQSTTELCKAVIHVLEAVGVDTPQGRKAFDELVAEVERRRTEAEGKATQDGQVS